MLISILSDSLMTEPGQMKKWVRSQPSLKNNVLLTLPSIAPCSSLECVEQFSMCLRSQPKYMNLADTLHCNGKLIVNGFPFLIFSFCTSMG